MGRKSKLKPKDMPVMQRQCATCPFREGSSLSELRPKIEERALAQASQTCHSTGLINGKPDTHLCRGARDFQLQFFFRIGFLDSPTDEAWEKKVDEIGL